MVFLQVGGEVSREDERIESGTGLVDRQRKEENAQNRKRFNKREPTKGREEEKRNTWAMGAGGRLNRLR